MSDAFSFKKLISGPLDYKNYLKVGVYVLCGLILFTLYTGIMSFFKKDSPTSSTPINIAKGATVGDIRIVNKNDSSSLKQGVYGRLSSLRAGIGVFKEVMPNIDVSVGGSKTYDDDTFEVEVETRFKF